MDNTKLSPSMNTAFERAAEINNALAVILGNAQLLLLKETVAPGDRDKLRAIEQSSFRIQTLIEQILLGKGPHSMPSASEDRTESIPAPLNSTRP